MPNNNSWKQLVQGSCKLRFRPIRLSLISILLEAAARLAKVWRKGFEILNKDWQTLIRINRLKWQDGDDRLCKVRFRKSNQILRIHKSCQLWWSTLSWPHPCRNNRKHPLMTLLKPLRGSVKHSSDFGQTALLGRTSEHEKTANQAYHTSKAAVSKI